MLLGFTAGLLEPDVLIDEFGSPGMTTPGFMSGMKFALGSGRSSADIQQVSAALETMGYSKAEINPILRRLPPETTVEQKIRFALRELGK